MLTYADAVAEGKKQKTSVTSPLYCRLRAHRVVTRAVWYGNNREVR